MDDHLCHDKNLSLMLPGFLSLPWMFCLQMPHHFRLLTPMYSLHILSSSLSDSLVKVFSTPWNVLLWDFEGLCYDYCFVYVITFLSSKLIISRDHRFPALASFPVTSWIFYIIIGSQSIFVERMQKCKVNIIWFQEK